MSNKDSTQNQAVKRYFKPLEINATLDCPDKHFHDATNPYKSQWNFNH